MSTRRQKSLHLIRYLFFDAGGTLIDLDYSYLKRLLNLKGYDADESLLAFAEGKARVWVDRQLRKGSSKPVEFWRNYFNILFREAGAKDGSMEDVIEHLWEKNAEDGLWKTPISGVLETLELLKKRGYRMSVISNAHGRVENDLRDAGLAKYFEHIVDSHWVGFEKPDPKIFTYAMQQMNASPSESLYIGDVFSIDIVGARRAGMKAYLLDRYSLMDDVDCAKLKRFSDILDHLN